MVTGAGGSIGSELCRQIVRHEPAEILLFERSENSLHAIATELIDGRVRGVRSIVGDVTDVRSIRETMRDYQPELIFHAAAHKHVPLMESNVSEAVRNNVRGTRLMIEAAERWSAERFVMISTDKAVNATSVMGATKRVAELILQTRPITSRTWLYGVRFGNVLASSGSVIPRFMTQIGRGGPVTITHPEMRRYFIVVPEAVQLVLHAAAEGAAGGIYALEMGEQLRIVDVARNLIRLAGFVPDEEIPIQFVGLRPGEKLSEELVGEDEIKEASGINHIMYIRPARLPDRKQIEDHVRELERAADRGDSAAVLRGLQTIVPSFRPEGLATAQSEEPATHTPALIDAATAMGPCRTAARRP